MPELNWIGKDKVINHDKELPYRVLKADPKLSVGDKSDNLIINGDNLEALKSLMPTYYNQVKCIYIDPPYNTNNDSWVYSDRVNSPQIKAWINKVVGPEGEDLCRHDKWLCMMYPRLKLLHQLLKDDGVIFVSIDDNEQHNLRQIMDEIFGARNFVANIIWQKNYSPRNDAKYFSDMHDHIVVYAKKKNIGTELNGWERKLLARTSGQDALYKNPDNDPRGVWMSDNLSVKTYSAANDYEITTPAGRKVKPPVSRVWSVSPVKFDELVKDNRIWFGKDGKGMPRMKRFLTEVKQGTVPVTLWLREDVGDNQEAKRELNAVLAGTDNKFETPKPSRLIKQIIRIATDENDIVLDSFAGSGTTGHAVLELNKEDGGKRKFIEVELEQGIAEHVTAHRARKVIEGYDGARHPGGTGGDFRYLDLNGELFDTNGFISSDATYEDLAAYVYFTETRKHVDLTAITNPYVGKSGGKSFYLLYKEPKTNTLTEKLAEEIKPSTGSTSVVYADKCLIDTDTLTAMGIIFKQIPYELKKY
jgi:adenine-specific DNA-methyltransferase